MVRQLLLHLAYSDTPASLHGVGGCVNIPGIVVGMLCLIRKSVNFCRTDPTNYIFK